MKFIISKQFVVICISFLLCFTLVQPVLAQGDISQTSVKPITKIEFFTIETMSDTVNSLGLYEVTGYKNVQALTTIKKANDSISTQVSSLEDYYDNSGNYIRSIISNNEFQNDLITGNAKTKQQQKEVKAPLVTKDVSLFAIKNKVDKIKYVKYELSESDLNSVKSNVEKSMLTLSKTEFKNVEGFTQDDINKIKAEVDEHNKELDKSSLLDVSTSSSYTCPIVVNGVEKCGAYDTYYNHNISTGAFTTQALGFAGHNYIRITGSTVGSSKNANTVANFKSNANGYDQTIVNSMESNTFTEVTSWYGVLMGLITIVVGYPAGPPGWVSIVLYYGGALATFASLTSTVYADYSRLSLSRTAAQYAENCSTINKSFTNNYENYTNSFVSGF